MIAGGAAVALHGYFRHSINLAGIIMDKPDIDFWYNPTYENYFNLLNALEELGQDVTAFKQEQSPNPKKSFFRYELENCTLDFLPELKGQLKFRLSFEKRENFQLLGTDVAFINYDDLIKDKNAISRPKGITDIQELKKKRKKED